MTARLPISSMAHGILRCRRMAGSRSTPPPVRCFSGRRRAGADSETFSARSTCSASTPRRMRPTGPVRSAAVLFSGIEAADGGSGDVRFIVNKEADADNATLLFQSGWSGRAEIGLSGDTDFVFKVSPDGG